MLFRSLAAAALAILLVLLFQKVNVYSTLLYVVLGTALWFALYKSGVHPTLAGVILGLMTPNIAKEGSGHEDSTDGSVSIIEWLESKIHPWSVFVIVPLFAFANTGVEISSNSIQAALDSPIAWGIFAGLVIGKPVGIFLSIYVARKSTIGEIPEGAKPLSIFATGSAAGIGFTVAIFIANLAFKDAATQDLAVVSVIAASSVSGLVSYVIFALSRKH